MTKTIYRSVTSVRRTSRPRAVKRTAGFLSMLSRLDTASATLQRHRRRK